ncbi:carbohydrate ABC transporter substrate-binding protein (CUT1 family) [Orenia metallireducens]|uniref:Carbohydrate ABC transporter substrate-binding protein, CUT1 family n=2 Tax=Orenia metallireducens TaxID=1413210 RepID=A0A285IH55_9FIRM|nr:ABC transporter substrate-binding protein [Orenia metallireducens]PRX17783.1 carbohydrate ABC transporter substrate-binding protein (CUT1 family) [Orenia metallireducens]SNY47315.1 carbohydrate ABC transporter substrate-binding protein, CUT1 family [Orenia metallireducens]
MKFNFKKNVVLTLTLFLLILAGCTNSTTTKTDDISKGSKKEKIELSFYFPVSVGGPVTKIIDQLAEDFMAENPTIKVNPIYAGSYADTMTRAQTSVQGGNPPDLAVILATELYTLRSMDAIEPLDRFIEDDYINDFYEGFLENSQADGKTWSIPFQRSTPVMYYNKEAFAKAGLNPEKPPKNWDQLLSYAKKLTIKDGSGEVEQWGVEIPSSGFPYWLFQGFALQNGKNLMSDDGKEVYFDTPENVEALQFIVDLSRKYGVMPKNVIDWATVPSDFMKGKTAIMYHTTGNLTNVKNNADFEFGVAYQSANKSYGSPTGGGNLYIFKDIPEEHKKAAWKFIKWLTTPKRAAQWSIDTGYIATRKSAYETKLMKDYVKSFPPAAVARDQLEYASAELSTYNNGRIYQVINDNLQAAIVGDKSPAEALKDAQQEADRILKPYN